MLTSLIALTQLIFTFVIGIYFFDQLQLQHSSRKGIEQDTKRELERLNRMRKRALIFEGGEAAVTAFLWDVDTFAPMAQAASANCEE